MAYKKKGDIVNFLKQKEYIMVNDDLGSGSFGRTVLLKDPYIDELFVAKKYEPEYEGLREKFYTNFISEIKILYKLNHRNIVRIYNYYPYESIYTGYILMEYIEGRTIDDFLDDYVSWIEDLSLDEMFTQLIDAFVYMEKSHIIHRDIREKNIMVDNNNIVKIIDFGIGKIHSEKTNAEDSLRNEINRPSILPKEYYDKVYTIQTDMFYLAELLNRLINNDIDNSSFSYQFILDKMMKINPRERYSSFSEIKEIVGKRKFAVLSVKTEDKKIYQDFADTITNRISKYISPKKFETNIQEFVLSLETLIEKTCLEDFISSKLLINTIIKCGYRYYTQENQINLFIVRTFYKWFIELESDTREIVYDNLIYRLSSIDEMIEEELPF